jgi:type IV secretory pathway TraG/TraD family ATPase VirD4
MVSKVQMSAMKRQKIPKEERKDFFMYIDEFQNYITPAIESILSEARKYRLGMVLANQYS